MYRKPLVVHSGNRNIYVIESLDPKGEISQQLIEYADIIQAPEEVHTYSLSPYSLWTAKAKGKDGDEIVAFLEEHAQNVVPESLIHAIRRDINHFGALEFSTIEDNLILKSKSKELIAEIKEINEIKSKIIDKPDSNTLIFKLRYRKEIKKILFEKNLFVKDTIYEFGDELDVTFTNPNLLEYQSEAVSAYLTYNHQAGGGGTIIMPLNSGKILVGLKIIETLKTSTLIIVEDKYKLEKWKQEIIDKTDIPEENIATFEHGGTKLKPITIGTYQNLCDYVDELQGFGFVIYDDAHSLPTPKHEQTVEIKAKNKLALASTLARSDGNGRLVLALVGPKWYEILHRTLVNKKYQVPVICVEVKIPLSNNEWQDYVRRNPHKQVNADTLNSNKKEVVKVLLKKEVTKRTLIVSYFNEVLTQYRDLLDLKTLNSQLDEENRQLLLKAFNDKEINKLITPSKLIENMPLKIVEVMIALSHQQGSEREEYLRLGKLLPAEGNKTEAVLYSLVSQNTDEERYYSKRRRALINYGFHYKIKTFADITERGEFFES